MEYERSVSGTRVDMVAGIIAMGADIVALVAAVARTSGLRSGVRCSLLDGQ